MSKSLNSSWMKFNRTYLNEYCVFELPDSYDTKWLIAHCFLAAIGIFYGLFGYRSWRLNMFLTSFTLASILLYVILSSQPTLLETHIIAVSISIGTLVGLIATLLQYVGLFIKGFCFGLIFSITTFIFLDMKNSSNGISTSFWVPIGLILCIGLVCAMTTLRFQKAMLILSSSCFSGLCQFLVLDYFLQSSVLSNFIHQRFIFQSTPDLCLRHWIIGLILPLVMLFGIVIQFSCTGRNYDHRDAWHRAINAGRRRCKTGNLDKIRRHYRQDTLRQQIIPDESNRFRYFYHIRRANGDALSSDFIQNIRQKNSSNEVQDVKNPPATSQTNVPINRINTDSTTTTLTHLM